MSDQQEVLYSLIEFDNVSQNEKDSIRRWFLDDFYDLIVWYDLNNNITGFQLCYGDKSDQKAITFSEGSYSHRQIQTEVRGFNTPILSDSIGKIDPDLYKDFLTHADKLEDSILEYIKIHLQSKI